ncbi:hypothetical protein B6R96_36080 (plasmid) [Streptomyces sp. Sge12]|nr:hypothetical protein B6R96_36080 [Streptomyces sp. Sge12]
MTFGSAWAIVDWLTFGGNIIQTFRTVVTDGFADRLAPAHVELLFADAPPLRGDGAGQRSGSRRRDGKPGAEACVLRGRSL